MYKHSGWCRGGGDAGVLHELDLVGGVDQPERKDDAPLPPAPLRLPLPLLRHLLLQLRRLGREQALARRLRDPQRHDGRGGEHRDPRLHRLPPPPDGLHHALPHSLYDFHFSQKELDSRWDYGLLQIDWITL